MRLLSMKDAANPDAPLAKCDVAAGYLGGQALHTWSIAQWRAQTARWLLPIWVAHPDQPGADQALKALAALELIGAPDHITVALDLETHKARIEVDQWGRVMHASHILTMPYGSTSTLFANPPRAGYWVADPTGAPHLYEHPFVLATQYEFDAHDDNGNLVDRSVIRSDVALWDTQPGAPGVTPRWQLEAINNLARAEAELRAVRHHIINRT